MILHQLDLGTTFDYIGADGFYGNDCNLARKIDQLGLTYMLDIHSNQLVYLEKPELVLPERKGNRGPKPKRLTVTEVPVKVSDYIKGLDRQAWPYKEGQVRYSTVDGYSSIEQMTGGGEDLLEKVHPGMTWAE